MAEDWFWEPEYPGFEQRYVVERRLWSGRSPLQEIEVIETRPFGRALVLDGALQTTQADEFCYHEMLVHPAHCAHPAPRRVLVIGGGDGGALRVSNGSSFCVISRESPLEPQMRRSS